MSWVVVATLVIVVVIWVGVHRFEQRHSQDPKTWPLVGAQVEAIRNFDRLHDWYLTFFSHRHRTVKLSVISGTLFFTVEPLNVEHILKTNFHNYPKGQRAHHIVHDFLGDGIFSSDGETWKKHRKVSSLEFSNRKLRDFSSDAFRVGALRLTEILHSAAISEKIVDLQDLFMRMTLDSICKVGFGVHVISLSQALPDAPFGRAFDRVNELTTLRFFNPFWELQKALNIGNEKLLKQEMKTLNSFTKDVIQKRRAELQVKKEGEIPLPSLCPGLFTACATTHMLQIKCLRRW